MEVVKMDGLNREGSVNFLNIVKGLAIFLMIWGHCIQYCIPSGVDFFENVAFKIIYSFHMPLFMLVSGYLFYFSFQKRDCKELLKHRSQGLIYGIIFGNIFIWFTTICVLHLFRGDFSILLNGSWVSSFGGLWFLWSVLTASIVLGVVLKKIKNPFCQWLCLILGVFFVWMFPCGELNAFMYPYFLIGFLFARYKDKVKSLNWLKYLAIPIYIVAMFFFTKEHYIYTTGLLGGGESRIDAIMVDLFRWAVGLFGSISILTILELLYTLLIRKTNKFILWRGIECIGEKSLQMYVISVAAVSFWLPYIMKPIYESFFELNIFFIENMWFYNCIFTVVLTIFYCIVLYWILKLFDKLKISRIIFGR